MQLWRGVTKHGLEAEPKSLACLEQQSPSRSRPTSGTRSLFLSYPSLSFAIFFVPARKSFRVLLALYHNRKREKFLLARRKEGGRKIRSSKSRSIEGGENRSIIVSSKESSVVIARNAKSLCEKKSGVDGTRSRTRQRNF